ncbi:hypothetical protein ACVWYH_010386 [Bradyrhizobium sp. GM24.11]
MSIYINGDDANLAAGVRLHQAVNDTPKSDGAGPGVPYVREGDVGRSKQEADRQVTALEAKLKDLDAAVDWLGFVERARVNRAKVQSQLHPWKRIQENLKQTHTVAPAPSASRGASAGTKRWYLNAPVGIPPPP